MNTISIVALIILPFLVGYGLYIDAIRRGRDGKGRWSKRTKKQAIRVTFLRFIPIKYFGRIIGFITL